MKLVIAEKPSVAKQIASVIGKNITNKDGYIDCGNNYIISWCVGHLVSLANAEEYDESLKKWSVETLPIIPENWKYRINKSTSKQFSTIKKLINNPKIDSIVCATDAGREGELIFMLVYNKINSKKPVERLWISSMEDAAIRDGFDNLKPSEEYKNLYYSALARMQADWIVGINATRLYSSLYNNKLSVGRVQTPTLNLIAQRDREITNFKKQKYFIVEINNGEYSLTTERIDNVEIAEQLINTLPSKLEISDVEEKEKITKPDKPYDLTTLQRECNKYFGYSAKETLDYVQNLYEKKLVTYPRTDSRYLTDDMKNSIGEYFNKIGFSYNEENFEKIFNSSKVSDHHAIIPTISSINNEIELNENEIKVFELIKLKLIASSDKNLVESLVKVTIDFDKMIFKANGKATIQEGFTRHFKEYINSKEIILPNINKGDTFEIQEKNIFEKFTSPPSHFTEDKLLLAMERAGVEDLDKELETEKEGLGTPATRASIIEKLISTDYVTRDKKKLLATDKAFELIDIVPEALKSPKTTAIWENKLTLISKGKESSKDFIDNISYEIRHLCNNYNVKKEYVKESLNEILGICPKCKHNILEGKKVYFCTNKDCDFRIYKEICSKKISKNTIKDILKNGKSEKISGFISKKGNKFSAKLFLKEDNSIGFDFN